MRKIYLLFGFVLCTLFYAQNLNIPDTNFKAILLQSATTNSIAQDVMGANIKLDNNSDGEIQLSEAALVGRININLYPTINPLSSGVTSIVGIKEFTNLQYLKIHQFNNLTSVDLSNMPSLLGIVLQNNTGLTQVNLQNTTNFTILALDNTQISSLDLQNYSNLQTLWVSNTQLSSLNVNGCSALSDLVSHTNQLSSIDLSTNLNLQSVIVHHNNLTTINLSNLTQLETLNCSFNNLASINLQNTPALKILNAGTNQLGSVDFSQSPALEEIALPSNQLSAISLNNLSLLEKLNVGYNQLTSIDLSNNPLANSYIYLWNNPLQYMNIKNGTEVGANFHYANTPQLTYICCDTEDFQKISSLNAIYNYTNCNFNSYCSFTPGGTSYTLQGNTKYDEDNNGCDSNDLDKSLQMFSIAGNGQSGAFVTNASGNYSISMNAGTHTITPILENPTYFSIAPPSITANFPSQTSPLTQNFCLIANGVFNDLEVVMIPITAATPGFNATYKILYKNKGTTTQSGNLNFIFNDNLTDYVSSSVAPTSQTTGNLNWNFTNLVPFETREILVTLEMNTPTETPPLNGGAVLNFSSQVTAGTDETPADNTSDLAQTVVNSFDPNDKTCLEGTSIAQSQVGDYVHYLIRFENTGTANAQNIVVKDVIDTTKFDINSLVSLHGSHSFVTRITNPNTIEFVFENIQLPFNNASNDGYVLFKIKTLSTLTPGDSFSNTANIFFDYNFPIVTNTSTTQVQQVLSVDDVSVKGSLEIYPNPVKDFLYIKSEKKLDKIEVYDTSGRIILTKPVDRNQVDLSNLETGNYIIKLIGDEEILTQKMMKK